MYNIPVILGTVREGRKSIYPARFLVEKIKQTGNESQLVDFKEIPLPFLNCEKEPYEYKCVYPDSNVQLWSNIAQAADGFVIVTPEYNHGYPAVLKNALDWLSTEFHHKPVGLVGVSNGLVGGARVIEQLRPILENFAMFGVRETVMFRSVHTVYDTDGKLLDENYNKSVDGMISSLLFSVGAMKSVR